MSALSSPLVRAAGALDAPASDDLEGLATFVWLIAGSLDTLSVDRRNADPDTRARIGALVQATAPFVRFFASDYALRLAAPSLVDGCRIPKRPASPFDAIRFMEAVTEFAETDLGRRPAYRALAELAGEMRGALTRSTAGSSSGMRAEYDDCAGDPTASASGDNAGCDALNDACAVGDMLACNDLYWSSPLGSTYESFGATCGRRVRFGESGFGGFCGESDGD
jgi:hypothetical protein